MSNSDVLYVGIGSMGFKTKPTIIPPVKYDTVKNYDYYSLAYIADKVGNEGHALMPAKLEGGIASANFMAMQLFLLDFDGMKTDAKGNASGVNISYEDVKARAEQYDLHIAFAYKTLSCPDGDKFYKFRIAFVHELPIDDPNLAQYTYNMLKYIFPEADGACTELSRLFLGGKELIDYNENSPFNLVQLHYTLKTRIYYNNDHLMRTLKALVQNTQIGIINKSIVVDYLRNISIYGENLDPANIISMDQSSLSPIFYYKDSNQAKSVVVRSGHNDETRNDEDNKIDKHRIDLEQHKGVCRLMDAFLYDEFELEHMELFLLATNLNCIRKGRKMFSLLMRNNKTCETKDIDKWERDWNWIKRSHPQSCCSVCRFYDECSKINPKLKNPLLKILNNDKKIFDYEEHIYHTIKEEEKNLESNLKKFMKHRGKGIHIIGGSTGIGKTFQIISLIKKYPNEKFIIAEPTCDLKNEVYDRITEDQEINDEILNIMSVKDAKFITKDEKEEYQAYHNSGMHRKGKRMISDKLKTVVKNRAYATEEIKELKSIRDAGKNLRQYRVVVTTHARILNMSEEELRGYIIIIDEDILTQLLTGNHRISKACLEDIANSGVPGYSSIAQNMLQAKKGVYVKVESTWKNLPEWENSNERYASDDFDYFEDDDQIIIEASENNNITDLREMSTYIRKGDYYIYFCARYLPSNLAYVVLSATYDEKIYRDYFGEYLNIYVYPECRAKYTGRLIQYTQYSFSRRVLANNLEIYDFIKNDENIKLGLKKEIISFYREYEAKRAVNSIGVYFGRAIGLDGLKGKNIAIIGTPFDNPLGYELVCCHLYGPSVVNGQRMTRQRVKHKGKSFILNTYSQPDLQRYMLYVIDSKLEQCIGRARLLRENCTVYLFSSFPCCQAELISGDYLENYKEDKEEDRSLEE